MGEDRSMALRVSFNAATKRAAPHQASQVRWSGNIQAVKLRMKQVANIAKITKAMQMVASSKLRGAETRVKASRPLTGALSNLFGTLETSEAKSECLVTVTSDAGLCGGSEQRLIKSRAPSPASLDLSSQTSLSPRVLLPRHWTQTLTRSAWFITPSSTPSPRIQPPSVCPHTN